MRRFSINLQEMMSRPIGDIDEDSTTQSMEEEMQMLSPTESEASIASSVKRSGDKSSENGNNWLEWDVPMGRSQKIRNHPGNIRYRQLIEDYHQAYQNARKRVEKSMVSNTIYNMIKSNGGRFLDRKLIGEGKGEWYEISEEKALAKISQALRQCARSKEENRKIEEQLHSQTLQRSREATAAEVDSSGSSFMDLAHSDLVSTDNGTHGGPDLAAQDGHSVQYAQMSPASVAFSGNSAASVDVSETVWEPLPLTPAQTEGHRFRLDNRPREHEEEANRDCKRHTSTHWYARK